RGAVVNGVDVFECFEHDPKRATAMPPTFFARERGRLIQNGAMSARSPSPIVQQLASRPCRLCGGVEFTWLPSVVFAQVPGSSSHYFEMLVCRACRNTDMFV